MPKAYFIDVQGTLIDDLERKPIRGAIEFIEHLNVAKIPYLLITNNTRMLSREFHSFLRELGFLVGFDSYIDTFTVLADTIPVEDVAVFGSEHFIGNIRTLGYRVVNENPKAIIISLNQHYTNEDYARMIEFVLAGAEVIGMHGTSIYAKEGRSYPGVGAILAMVEYATKHTPIIVGKPSRNFYEKGLRMLQEVDPDLTFGDIEIISDDVVGDLVGAKALGMETTFVLSGKYKNADIVRKLGQDEKPDHIYRDMAEILEELK